MRCSTYVRGSDTSPRSAIRALADTGAEATTTPQRALLHNFEKVHFKKFMADASNKHHASLGQGFIKLRRDDGVNHQSRYILVHSWWTPSLPITVFSPAATVERHKTQYKGYSTTLDHVARTGTVTLHSCLDPSHDVHLPGVKKRLLLYTALLVPSGLERLSDVSPQITHLSARATQVL
jgi:hypothetical protein